MAALHCERNVVSRFVQLRSAPTIPAGGGKQWSGSIGPLPLPTGIANTVGTRSLPQGSWCQSTASNPTTVCWLTLAIELSGGNLAWWAFVNAHQESEPKMTRVNSALAAERIPDLLTEPIW